MAFTATISHSVYLIANTLTVEMSGRAYQDDILDLFFFLDLFLYGMNLVSFYPH